MRLKKTAKELPYIVAVDFDGTLVDDAYPEIGEPHKEIIAALIQIRRLGFKVILWTNRTLVKNRDYLEEAVEFCKSQGLEFDAINENLPEAVALFGEDTRKIYADLYIDDKAANFNYLMQLYYYVSKEKPCPEKLS